MVNLKVLEFMSHWTVFIKEVLRRIKNMEKVKNCESLGSNTKGHGWRVILMGVAGLIKGAMTGMWESFVRATRMGREKDISAQGIFIKEAGKMIRSMVSVQ